MKFISFWQNQLSAVGYISHFGSPMPPIEFPHLPHLISIERVLLFLLFIFLVRPLLRSQKDPKLEEQRINVLKLSTAAGGLALAIHLYRLVSGY